MRFVAKMVYGFGLHRLHSYWMRRLPVPGSRSIATAIMLGIKEPGDIGSTCLLLLLVLPLAVRHPQSPLERQRCVGFHRERVRHHQGAA
jgi:hypothetical protein